ncbi:unnamed protein product, partial [marine sediment metagenome]
MNVDVLEISENVLFEYFPMRNNEERKKINWSRHGINQCGVRTLILDNFVSFPFEFFKKLNVHTLAIFLFSNDISENLDTKRNFKTLVEALSQNTVIRDVVWINACISKSNVVYFETLKNQNTFIQQIFIFTYIYSDANEDLKQYTLYDTSLKSKGFNAST